MHSVGQDGKVYQTTNTASQRWELDSTSSWVPTSNGFSLILRIKFGATIGTGQGFGVRVAGGAGEYRGSINIESGVVILDFGGYSAGTTRLSVATSQTSGTFATFVATTGPRGMEIWRDGVLIGSNAANPTRTSNAGITFALGDLYGGSAGAAEYGVAAAIGTQLTTELARKYSGNVWQLFAPLPRRIWAPAAAASGTTITGALGTAVATGYTATVNANRTIAGSVGTATASGYTATVNANRTVAGSVGTATASGFTASLNINKTISGAVGEVVASGYQATVTTSGNTTITGIVGVATASGYTATVNANRTIASTVGVATASGYTATVSNSADTTINGSVGIAVATGFSALINANRTITGSTGTVVASGYTGTVSNGGLTDAEFRQMYDWLAALSAIDYLTVPKFIALK